jgi:Transcriptional Coactivator p15 (PC4)
MSGPDYIGGPVWQHRKRNEVRLAGPREYRGATFFDIRIWHDQGGDQLAPGKGVTIPLDAIESLHRALGEWLRQRGQPGSLRAVD